MTDKEKKSKIADILMDFQEEYSNEVINRPMLASLYAGNILSFIDSLQEEPVSKDFEMALTEMVAKAQKCVVEPWVVAAQWKDELIKLAKSEESVREDLEEAAVEAFKQIVDSDRNNFLEIFKAGAKWGKEQTEIQIKIQSTALPNECPKEGFVSEDLEKAAKQYEEDAVFYAGRNISDFFKAGAKWQKKKDESTTEDLGEYINELSKQFPEVSFAKLSRIAVRAAKWQKAKDEKVINENALLYNARLEGIEIGKAEMKQQMMAKAIDGDITFDYYGDDDKIYGCIAHNSFCLEDFGLKDRDKVKVIVIKED